MGFQANKSQQVMDVVPVMRLLKDSGFCLSFGVYVSVCLSLSLIHFDKTNCPV